jgi:S-adenosylmethionine:tRNA-ribosyltransferase-isomerase (queuine synthetase)
MRCLVTAGKHVNNTRAIARQLHGKRVPAATVEVLLEYNSGNGVFSVRAEVL